MKNPLPLPPLFAAAILLGIALAACSPKPAALDGTQWTATELNGSPVLPDSAITLEFLEDRIAGSAGCNRYFASYTIDGEQLSFGPAGATLMYCEGLMEQEALFLSSLEKVESYSLADATLTLHLNDGGSIVLHQQ